MKKFLKVIGFILLHAAILLLIPLNKYVCDLNEVLTIAVAAIWLITLQILFWKKTRKKTGIILLDVFVWAYLIFLVMINPYWNCSYNRLDAFSKECDGEKMLNGREALEDFDYAMKYLKRLHPLAYRDLPADVEAKAEQVRRGLESRDSILTYELGREIQSVFALLNDGHTGCSESYENPRYMKYIYRMKTEGYIPVGINGERYEDFLKNHPGLVCYETESYGIRRLKNRTNTLEGLRYLGIDINGEITYNYETEDGENVDRTVTADDFLPLEDYYDYIEEDMGVNVREEDEEDFVYYDIDESLSLAILTLNSCEFNNTYKQTLAAMFKEIREKGIRNVAVDLRYNGGGSSRVADEFISYLDVDEYKGWAFEWRMNFFKISFAQETMQNPKKADSFDGDVYIITSVNTFSSAMDFAMLIQDNGIGTIVGEPCGNLPGSYGEVVGYNLPNSGIYFQVSTKDWHRVDITKDEDPIIPDIECRPDEALEVLKERLK